MCQSFYRLLRKNVPLSWNEGCQKNFEEFKKLVTQEPILGAPKVDGGPFILTTDAFLLGVGSCLAQQQGDKEVTMSFWSISLNASKRNYCITHLELLAVVTGIEAHHHFLIGAPFILRTDHSALQWLKSSKNLRGRLAR